MKRKTIISIASIFVFAANTAVLIFLFTKIENPNRLIKFLILSTTVLSLIQLIFSIINKSKSVVKISETEVKINPEEIEKLTQEEEAEKKKQAELTEKTINESAERILKSVNSPENKEKFSEALLKTLASEFSIVQGIVFLINPETNKYGFSAGYALYTDEKIKEFAVGEGISGQVAKNMEMLNISNIPENYITVLSGLGSSSPKHLLIFPLIEEFDAVGIVEISTFSPFPQHISKIYKQINEPLGKIAAKLIYPDIEKEETF
jgi:cell division protein FtsB